MTRWPVRDGNAAVGHVTSAVYSPRLKKNIGYAMLPVERAALGTKLRSIRPMESAATWSSMPFIDPTKARAKG